MRPFPSVRVLLESRCTPEPNSGCLLFDGPVDCNGYARVRRHGKLQGLHRLVWESSRGPIPAGMCVCHKCDVPSCVNVEHLFLGTHADNMKDRQNKGRGTLPHLFGERSANAKLSDDNVRIIRQSGLSQHKLAHLMGCSQSNISLIRAGISR